MKTALIKSLTAWMLGLSVFIGVSTGPVQLAAAETLLVGDTVQLVVLAPFYTELSWNNYAGYLGYQPIGARGKVLVGPTVDAWTTWVRVDLTLPTSHVIGWVQVSQVAKVTTTSVAPSITSQPSSATVTAPATASFSASASGTAPLSYQWQKNGASIPGATSAIYMTPATSTLDSSSTFRVVVTNSAGSVTSNVATLTVLPGVLAPAITSQPSSATVTAPAPASFSVSASGTSLNYQWKKNGTVVGNAATYTTPATSTADSGSTFVVVVSNTAGSVTSNVVMLTVIPGVIAPTITTQPANATVTAPASATFNVSASGTTLSYQWKKNGAVVGTAATYTTPATSTADSGSTFLVVVSNSAGSVTSSAATLTVNAGAASVALSYSGKLRDKVGQNNGARLADGLFDGTFTMTLGTGSGPRTVTQLVLRNTAGGTWDTIPSSIYWTLGVGSGLDSALSQNGSDAVNFTMAPGGSMTLFATDCCGGMFATGTAFTLTVTFSDGTTATALTTVSTAAVAPSITTQPSNATVTAPASATFSVGATGTSLNYQWQKNSTNISGATGTSYTTLATTVADSGSTFRVVVTNSAGTVTSSAATLTVNAAAVAPTITTQPGTATVTGPATATFSVSASGTAPLTYQWQKNNVNISGATSSNYTTPATSTADSGSSFRVVVTNTAGSITSSAATLIVNAPTAAPTITTQPVNVTVTAPASATFSVNASGTALLSYQWQKNTVNISGATAASYTTPAASAADSGSSFRVVVTNSAGSITSSAATLTVNPLTAAPTIITQPASATVTAPASATFSVGASGTSLNYQWQKNSTNISGATGMSYTTLATTVADSGSSFRVVVSNSAGSITSNAATLTVNAAAVAPTITTQPAPAAVPAPAAATFSVSASGTALLSYQWQKNTANILGATSASYTTPATSTADSGSSFRVVVTNSAGSITSSAATLTVNAPADTTPPSVPTALNASASSCSQININWGVSTDTGGSGLKGYNVYRNGSLLKQVLAPSASTSDSGLTPATAYSYNVAAIDNAGNQSSQGATSSTNTQPCNLPPVANAGPDKMGMLSTAVSLSGASSFDPDGMISTYAWSFGDSTSGSGVSVSHAYALAGIYAVTLTVTDSKGATASDTAIVTIASGPVNPTLIGFVPDVGAARDVVIDPVTGLAYVASGEFGLAVVDVANPAAPKAIGGTKPPFYGERLAVDGSMAVVTGNNLGLRVVDVSNPADPRTRGALSGTMRGVAVRGQYAYVLQIVPGNPARTDLLVVDLQRPEDPVVVGRITLAGGWAVRVAGGLAYVPADTAGLQIVDVSNPTAPWIVSTLDTPGAARDVAVAGSYAYVADTTSVQIVRVTTASSPALVGTLATSATAVAASGTRLYALGGSQFKVIDVTNAASPVLRSAIGNPDAHAVAGAGTFALLATPSVNAALNKGGLYVVDVAVPTAPVVRANVYGGFDNTGVAASGGRAVATGNSLGLKVVDVSNPLMPRLLGALGGTMKGVAMEGSYAYVLQLIPGNPARMDLLVVDASAVPPTVVGRVGLAWGITVKVLDGVVYVAADTVGLQIVNVNNPRAPWIMATIDTPGSARGVALANGYAYVADDTSVQVINITTPNNPVIVGSLPTTATAIAAAGGRVYVLGSGQFKILDVRNPPAPVLLSATTGFSAQALDVAGSLVFLATPASSHTDPKGGVYVLDVTTASRPTLVEQIAVPGTTRSITASGGFIYAGDSAGIVDVIMISP